MQTITGRNIGQGDDRLISIARKYVRVVDAVNYRIGRVMMYGIFVMMAILLWSSISKTFLLPSIWTLEVVRDLEFLL